MSRALGGLLILTENHTLVPPGDLDGLVEMARTAERAGMDAVMLGDHVCLGPSAGALGRPENPRSYAAPGNQNPATEWPSPIVDKNPGRIHFEETLNTFSSRFLASSTAKDRVE